MKKVFILTCFVLLLAASFNLGDKTYGSDPAISFVSSPSNVSPNQQFVQVYAWQAAPPVTPIEERRPTNWLWWAVGVALGVGGGVLLYFLIKKDPRQDVR